MNHLNTARRIANLLDSEFRLFGFKFGLDPILGLVPGLGDIVPALLSLYIVLIAVQARLPVRVIALMVGNVILDLVLGFLPVVGDVVDFFYKSNMRNLNLLERHLNAV